MNLGSATVGGDLCFKGTASGMHAADATIKGGLDLGGAAIIGCH